mgnify:CR=1 FL=1
MGAGKAVNGSEQFSSFARIGNCCEVLLGDRGECPFEVGGGVTLCSAGSDGVPEYLASNGLYSVSRFNGSPGFNASQ